MIRKNIQVTESHAADLRKLAYETKLSEAEHIRRALDLYLEQKQWEARKMAKNANTGATIKNHETSAAALYDGGWRSTDHDELIEEHGLTSEDATKICEYLKRLEDDETL